MLDRIIDILDTYYHYDLLDYDMDPETIEKTLLTDPKAIINTLLDIIDDLQE